jgi:hypothetical protein
MNRNDRTVIGLALISIRVVVPHAASYFLRFRSLPKLRISAVYQSVSDARGDPRMTSCVDRGGGVYVHVGFCFCALQKSPENRTIPKGFSSTM